MTFVSYFYLPVINNVTTTVSLVYIFFISNFLSAGMKSFRLHACREDGALEAQMVELTWDSITRWESDEESMSFCFQYNRPDKPARWVKVFTPYVS